MQYEKPNVFFIHHHVRNHEEVTGRVKAFAAKKSSDANPECMNRASNIRIGLKPILFSVK
jgi:hypothetical protein